MIYFFLERDAVLLFALRPESGYAVGEFVAGGELLSPPLAYLPVANADY